MRSKITCDDELLNNILDALKNQYAFDAFYYDLLGVNSLEFNGVPRPVKWLNHDKNKAKIIKKVSFLSSFLWGGVFAYIYFSLRALSYVIKKIGLKKTHVSTHEDVGIYVCDRSYDSICQALKTNNKIYWLGLPNSSQSNSKEKILEGSCCLTILSKGEILRALAITISVHYKLSKKVNKSLMFQSYVIFDLVLMLLAIQKIQPRNLIIAEHHDRWAILADYYCNRQSKQTEKVNLTIVQHGREYADTYAAMKDRLGIDGLPRKIKTVAKLFVYDEEQLNIFMKNIIEPHTAEENMEVEFFKPSIALSDSDGDAIKVLFVGHPICEDIQIYLFEMLKSKSGMVVFYKPHPTAKISSRVKDAAWILIKDTNYFPRVNLIVSYPSTLVLEYENAGVPAFIHQLNLNQTDFEIASDKLNIMIKQLNTSDTK